MSNNLGWPALVGGQANPETTVNDASGAMDASITETVTVDLTNSATISLANYRACIRIEVTTAGLAKTLTLRAVKRLVLIKNSSTNQITVALGSATFALNAATSTFAYTDGTANGLEQIAISGIAGTIVPADLSVLVPGVPVASSKVFRYNVVRPFTWLAGLSGSVFNAGVAATASSTFTIKQNGSTIGTLVWGAAGTVPVVTFAAAVTFAINDVITIVAPGVSDVTLADISLTFLGTRSVDTGLQPFDLGLFINGLPTAAQTVLRYNVVRAFVWQATFPGSIFNAGVAATGTSVFTIKRNGASIGTLSFAGAGTVPTVTFAADVFWAINDLLTIEAPGVQDATLADLAFNFLGSR